MPRNRAPAASENGSAAGKKGLRWNGAQGLKGHRREVILRSVANVLRNSTLSSITMENVADELGMTKGNLYYYFKDKQDILYQCHMRSMEMSLRALDEALSKGRSPTESLQILLKGHILGILEDGFGGILQTDFEYFSPDNRKRYVKKRDELERGVRSLIEQGVRAGELECLNIKLTGFAILGAINWIPKWYRPNGPFSSAQIAEEMSEYFLRGLYRREGAGDHAASKRRGRQSDKSKFAQAVADMERLR